MKEKKARVEDAMHATKAAVEEGIVPGGGVALVRSIPALDKLKATGDEQIGIDIVKRALEEPLRLIAANAGHEGAVVVEKVRNNNNSHFGFDAQTETYRRPGRSRRHRPDQGYPHRAAKRCFHRLTDAHHRGAGQRIPGEGRKERGGHGGPPGGGMGGGMY